MSQEQLAASSGLDRSYISLLERGLKSPTLTTLDKLLECLRVQPVEFFDDPASEPRDTIVVAERYLVRGIEHLEVARATGGIRVEARHLLAGVDVAHKLIDQLYSIDLDIAFILGLRNLSSFIGELFAAAVKRTCGGLFVGNPHQDGYPDLLLMDGIGQAEMTRLAAKLNDKAPFSPFAAGGIEVKATCGSVPTPKECRSRGIHRPSLGDSRIDVLTGYDWKAHHRETNNLAGIVWDFVDARPRIVAVFYSSGLEVDDWGAIVQPKAGGGRTTSVSIMNRGGIRKMYDGWLCVIDDDRYAKFFDKRNKSSSMSSFQP